MLHLKAQAHSTYALIESTVLVNGSLPSEYAMRIPSRYHNRSGWHVLSWAVFAFA